MIKIHALFSQERLSDGLALAALAAIAIESIVGFSEGLALANPKKTRLAQSLTTVFHSCRSQSAWQYGH